MLQHFFYWMVSLFIKGFDGKLHKKVTILARFFHSFCTPKVNNQRKLSIRPDTKGGNFIGMKEFCGYVLGLLLQAYTREI
jgi:hypothetical protein